MNLFQFISLFSSGTCLAIGVFAFFSIPSRKINQCFLLLTGVISIWQVNVYMGMSSLEKGPLIFWIRQSSAIAALIPSAMNLIRLAVVAQTLSLFELLLKNKWWFITGGVTAVICQTQWFLRDASLPATDQVLPVPEYGFGFIFFAVYFLVALGILFFFMLKNKRKLRGGGRAEIEYFLLSCGTSLFIGIFFLIFPYLTGWNDLGALLPLSVIVFCAINGYGIATRKILDVSVLLRRITSYSMVLIYLSILYLVTHGIVFFIFSSLDSASTKISNLIATLVVAFSVSPAHGLAQKLANRLFVLSPSLNVGEILSEASRTLNTVLTVDELCTMFHKLLMNKLETTELKILVRDHESFIQIYPRHSLRKLPVDSGITTLLKENTALCVKDVLQRSKSAQALKLYQHLINEDSTAVIGFHRKGQLAGFFILGERASGRLYARAESVAVEGLRDLFSVSYENARLYTELQNSQLYMDLLLKNLVNGVLATDSKGKITTCNQEAAKILNHDEKDLIGKNLIRLPKVLADIFKQVFDQDLRIRDRGVTLAKTNQESFYLNIGAALFRDTKGKVVGSLMVIQDRTAIHKLEEQVKRSERLASLGTLSAGMAHEIKNPLVTLQTFTQLLPERFHDADFRDTFVNLAGKEISRIDGLVNKLLTLARPMKIELEPIGLNSFLRSYAKVLREQAEDAGAKMYEDYHAVRDCIFADIDKLKQVTLNLFLNALQSMHSGGEIHIFTRDQGDQIELEIRDTGEGISQGDLNHVFDPFFTTKSSGTGLGLAVAYQIIQEHAASVRVESTPGRGTAFYIRFPLVKPGGNA